MPGGILAGLWNVIDDRVDWVAGLAAVSGNAVIGPRDTLSTWRAETANLHLPNNRLVARFGLPEQQISAFLASRPETARDELTVPMLTGVLRVRRRWAERE